MRTRTQRGDNQLGPLMLRQCTGTEPPHAFFRGSFLAQYPCAMLVTPAGNHASPRSGFAWAWERKWRSGESGESPRAATKGLPSQPPCEFDLTCRLGLHILSTLSLYDLYTACHRCSCALSALCPRQRAYEGERCILECAASVWRPPPAELLQSRSPDTSATWSPRPCSLSFPHGALHRASYRILPSTAEVNVIDWPFGDARRCATEADNSTARVARRPSVTCARCERCALPGERCALPAFVAFYETMRRNLRVATSFSWAQATMQAVRTPVLACGHFTFQGCLPRPHTQQARAQWSEVERTAKSPKF